MDVNAMRDVLLWFGAPASVILTVLTLRDRFKNPRKVLEDRVGKAEADIKDLKQKNQDYEKKCSADQAAHEVLKAGIGVLIQSMRVIFDLFQQDKPNPRIDRVKEVLDQYLINK